MKDIPTCGIKYNVFIVSLDSNVVLHQGHRKIMHPNTLNVQGFNDLKNLVLDTAFIYMQIQDHLSAKPAVNKIFIAGKIF